MRGVTIGGGAIATNVATGFISKFLPENLKTGPVVLGVKAAVGLLVLPMLLGFIPGGRKFANSVRLGAGVVIALDIWNVYIAPNIPGLSDYETGILQDYETGVLSGYGSLIESESIVSAPTGSGVYGGSIYGGA